MLSVCLPCVMCPFTVVPVAASVSADETEALKAEITKAVEKVQEAGITSNSLYKHNKKDTNNFYTCLLHI